jgi:hypothetical protein
MSYPADEVDDIRILVSPKGDVLYGTWDALALYREALVSASEASYIFTIFFGDHR